jgi:2-polyprenyl-6-methoxyphenol hydroxylase-like FAD-dependent oxidoreductase
MRAVHVVGGGPAGVMAAVAAMREGAGVRIFEKSAFPRHKVCGEFLSPAILPLLRRAGCEAGFLQLRRRYSTHCASSCTLAPSSVSCGDARIPRTASCGRTDLNRSTGVLE